MNCKKLGSDLNVQEVRVVCVCSPSLYAHTVPAGLAAGWEVGGFSFITVKNSTS